MEGVLHSLGSPCLHAPQRFLSQAQRAYKGDDADAVPDDLSRQRTEHKDGGRRSPR